MKKIYLYFFCKLRIDGYMGRCGGFHCDYQRKSVGHLNHIGQFLKFQKGYHLGSAEITFSKVPL